MRNELYFTTSPWFILACLAVGAAYAYFLYQPKPFWSKSLNVGLAFLRGFLVSLLCFLLMSPLVKTTQTTVDKPKVVLAIDNSESMKNVPKAVLAKAEELRQKLTAAGLEVAVQTLNPNDATENLSDLTFDQPSTDLSGLLTGIKNNYEGRNLTDVVLLTDGIVNQGLTPTFNTYPFKVHSVGVGDTLPKRDVAIKNVVANNVAYLGNQFPVQADVAANGFSGRATNVYLKQNGRILDRKNVAFGQEDAFEQVTFQVSSNTNGTQHYVVEVEPLAGEFTTRNNQRDVYIDIVDGKEKILLLALSSHPDVKALRTIIEKNDNYELDVVLFGSVNNWADLNYTKKYDLVILHQLPDHFGTGNDAIQKFLQRDNTPLFIVLGNQASAQSASRLNQVVRINAPNGQTDKVTARFNTAFKLLNLDADKLAVLEKLPPLSVPYGDYQLGAGGEVVLFQNVGSVRTNKPLLMINTSTTRKAAVLAGEGIWQWRLEEYALNETQVAVDELIQKTIQLISVKEDKRKFRVYPLNTDLLIGDKVSFETEIYNDIYEKTYGQSVKLDITSENGKRQTYNYTNADGSSRFELSGLTAGVYRYQATTSLNGGKQEQASGEFIIKDLQLEALNLTADFGMLRQLATQTDGYFVKPAQMEQLIEKLTSQKAPDRLDSTEEMTELINRKWLFFLLLLLVSLEWGTRKYQGSY